MKKIKSSKSIPMIPTNVSPQLHPKNFCWQFGEISIFFSAFQNVYMHNIKYVSITFTFMEMIIVYLSSWF